MRNGHEMHRKFLVDLFGNFANFAERHGFVSFVVEVERTPALGVISNAAIEGNDSPVFGRADMPDQSGLIDSVAHENEKIGLKRFVHGNPG